MLYNWSKTMLYNYKILHVVFGGIRNLPTPVLSNIHFMGILLVSWIYCLWMVFLTQSIVNMNTCNLQVVKYFILHVIHKSQQKCKKPTEHREINQLETTTMSCKFDMSGFEYVVKINAEDIRYPNLWQKLWKI